MYFVWFAALVTAVGKAQLVWPTEESADGAVFDCASPLGDPNRSAKLNVVAKPRPSISLTTLPVMSNQRKVDRVLPPGSSQRDVPVRLPRVPNPVVKLESCPLTAPHD